MKFSEEFSRVHSWRDVEIREKFSKATIEGSVIWHDDIVSKFIGVLSLLGKISSRDNFELLLSKIEDHENLSIEVNDESSIANMKDWLLGDEQDISFIITINKKITNGILSIYFINEFIAFLNEINIYNVISWFSDSIPLGCSLFEFEVFDEIDTFNTQSIIFHSINSKHESNEPINRETILNILKSSTKYSGLNINVTPKDFKWIKQSKFEPLNDLFEKIQVLLSIIYVSNNSYVKEETLYCDISNGISTVTIQLDAQNISINKELIYKIYLWIYGTEHAFDKLSITRNILLSAYNQTKKSIDINENIWSIIQSNFQIYMRKNFKHYLESKEKISNALMEISNKSFVIADEIAQSFKKGISVAGASLFLGIIVKGLEKYGVDFFSGIYLYIVLSLIAGFYIWFEISAWISRKRFWSITKYTYKILYNTYGGIVYKKEIKDNVKVANKLGRSHVNKIIKTTRAFALLMVIIGILFTIVGYLFIAYGVKS